MSYKKYYVYKQQYSEDGGRTWNDTDPLVTSPSGDPIGEYATLEECQGIAPTPTGCSRFIVDGGQWNDVPASGAATCDSAFLYVDGTPQFTPASAASWISIDMYHWNEDPHTYDYFCTVYTDAPCVANNLMKQAGIVDNDISCSDVPTPTMADMPEIVREAITGNNEYTHALGTIRYTVAPNTFDTPRSCTIRWIVDSEECPSRDFTISQLAGTPAPSCGCASFGVSSSGSPVSSAVTSTEFTIARYTAATDCTEPITFAHKSGVDFMGSLRADNYYLYGKVKTANTSTSARTSEYYVYQGSCRSIVVVTQEGKEPTPPPANTFVWRDSSRPTAYTATTNGEDTSLIITQFSSIYNGAYPNAVLSSNDSWIVTNSTMYYNNNEIKPYEVDRTNKYVYFEENDTGSERTGTLTLTQKGTSNTITLTIKQKAKVFDCDITSFALSESTVCLGGNLSYTYTMSNTGCTDKVYFALFDAGGHMYESESTPSGGSGSGTFSIPSTATTGQASVTIGTTDRHYVNISSCSSRSITGTIRNDSDYVIQKATFEYYVGSELRSVNFGGGIAPGSYRNVIVPISSEDAGKTWRAHKVTATTTAPEVLVDCDVSFTAEPTETTITDNFISFSVFLNDFTC